MSIEPLKESDRAPRHRGLAWPVRVGSEGGPTEAQARGDHWRRTSRGFYVPAEVDATHPEQRIVEAAVLVPDVAGITGWAGLRWCGGSWFEGASPEGRRPVVIASGCSDVRGQEGVEVCHERIPNDRLVTYDDVAVTVPARSVLFEMRRAPSLSAAVVCGDMAAYDDLVSISELFEYLPEHRTITGVPQARRAAALVSENSWSPMETRVRMRWMAELGEPTPLYNPPLFDSSGRHIATPDLLDLDRGLAIEYEGSVHLTTARRAHDRDRDVAMRDHGLEIVVIVGRDFEQPGAVAGKLWHALQRAETTLRHRRQTWTLDRPSWWFDTQSVSNRRALVAAGLGRLLQSHRAA